MRLNAPCPNCDKSVTLMSYAKSKSDFKKEVGQEIELFCEKCKIKSNIPSENFQAVRSSAMSITIVLLCLVVIGVSIFMLKYSWAVVNEYKVPYAALAMPVLGTISLIWYMFSDNKKIKFFNEN